jgi:hypothetical protein
MFSCRHYCSDDDICFGAFASSAAYVLITMLLLHVQQDLVSGCGPPSCLCSAASDPSCPLGAMLCPQEYCMDESGLDDAFITLAEEVDEISGTGHDQAWG